MLPPRAATATPFVLAGPIAGHSWGGRQNQPIASASIASVATAGRDRGSGEIADLPETLDVARAYGWFTVDKPLLEQYGQGALVPASSRAALAAKQAHAEPALLAELDSRFAALTSQVSAATSIELPGETQEVVGKIRYCGWIDEWQVYPSALRRSLRSRCLADRDRFIGALVRRLAELAVLPGLPPPASAVARALPAYPAVAGVKADDSRRLPQSVVPAEANAPVDYGALVGQFRAIVRARFEASLPMLRRQLEASLAVAASGDVLLTPEQACATMLGPYAAEPLAGSVVAGGVSNALRRECEGAVQAQSASKVDRIATRVRTSMEDALASDAGAAPESIRIDQGPAAMCQRALDEYLPRGRSYGQSAEASPLTQGDAARLTQACLPAASRIIEARLRRRAAFALRQARPSDDTPRGWDLALWFMQPPGGYRFFEAADPQVRATEGRYAELFEQGVPGNGGEPGEASVRKAAALRFVDAIDAAYSGEKYMDSDAAKTLCAGRFQSPGQAVFDSLAGPPPQDRGAIVASLSKLRAAPGLSASEAPYWVTQTCRLHSEALLRTRLAEASASARVKDVFAPAELLAVRNFDGDLKWEDPGALVTGAAKDGLQVRFAPGGFLSAASISVTPLGRRSPELSGTLREAARGDGVRLLEIRDMGSLPNLDGPLATLRCLGMPVESQAFASRMHLIKGLLTAGLSRWWGDGKGDVQEGLSGMNDAAACATAKSDFLKQ